jgi:acetyltransferase EpsM
MESCLIYGTGGHAKVLEELAIANGYTVAAFFDDHMDENASFRNIPVKRYNTDVYNSYPVLIGIGNNKTRKEIAARLSHRYCFMKDPSVVAGGSVSIGVGSVLLPGVVMQADCKIGEHCIINIGSAIDHEVIVENFAHIGPMCYIGGAAYIGEGVTIGAGSIIMRNVRIAPWTEIPPNSLIQ